MSMSSNAALRDAASNTEVMRHIFYCMDPHIDYQKVVDEFNDPRFRKWAEIYHRGSYSHTMRHPGRSWVRVLYPRERGSSHVSKVRALCCLAHVCCAQATPAVAVLAAQR